MSAIGPEAGAWSRRRWVAVVLGVFALHIAVLFVVSSRQERIPRRAESRASVRWLTDPVGARKTLDALLLTDPTQFAMVHSRGFSGAAWLRTQSPDYRPAEWTEAERSLAQPTQLLGGAFRQAATASEQPLFDPARKPAVAPPVTAPSHLARAVARSWRSSWSCPQSIPQPHRPAQPLFRAGNTGSSTGGARIPSD